MYLEVIAPHWAGCKNKHDRLLQPFLLVLFCQSISDWVGAGKQRIYMSSRSSSFCPLFGIGRDCCGDEDGCSGRRQRRCRFKEIISQSAEGALAAAAAAATSHDRDAAALV